MAGIVRGLTENVVSSVGAGHIGWIEVTKVAYSYLSVNTMTQRMWVW